MDNGPSCERNISNALDALNCAARENTERLGSVLNVVRGPRPANDEKASPTPPGLFAELEFLAYSLQKTNAYIQELERNIGHGGKSAMPTQPLGASGIGGHVGRPY